MLKCFQIWKTKALLLSYPIKLLYSMGTSPSNGMSNGANVPDLFSFKPKYYQGAESIYNDRMFNLLNLQKQEKVPCCITDIFLHHCHHITNRVWEISCYITIFYIPVLKYTCNNFTFMKFHLKIIINKIFYEP